MPPEAKAPPSAPLQGVERLGVGDVRMMLRPAFWLRPGADDGIVQAHSIAAVVALAGLAGLPAYGREGIRAEHILPDGRSSIVVRGLGGVEEHELAVRPAVAALLARLKRVHVVAGGDRLFIRPGGGDPYMWLWNAGRRLGASQPLWRLLRNFFEETLYRSEDADAIDCYLSIVTRGDGDPHLATRSALKRLVLRTDPLGGDVRCVRDDEYALKAALDAGSWLAATFAESVGSLVSPGTPRPAPPPLQQDHPLLVEIAAAKSKPGQKGAEMRLQICMRHMAELDRMKRDRSLPDRRAAALFGMTVAGYRCLLVKARRKLGMVRRGPPRPPKVRPAMMPKESARVARINAATWPAQTARRDFRRRLFAKHGAFVCSLVAAGKLGTPAAASLFGMSRYNFHELRSYAASGMITDRFTWATQAERAKWRDIVLRELPCRPPGPVTAFIKYLRKSFGVALPENVIYRIIRNADRPPDPSKHQRGPIRMALSGDEGLRLDAIASAEWLDGPEAEDYRRRFIAEHADFVFGLLRGRRIGVPDAGKLFRLPADKITTLSRLHLEGLLAQALQPAPPPEERERQKLLVRGELPRRPGDMPAAAFARQLTGKLRFHVPAGWIVEMLRAGVSGAAPLPPFGTKSRPALDEGERAHLKAMKTAMQDDGRDAAARRREVLRRDGAFLMSLLEGKKLGNEAAAYLLGVNPPMISLMRCDFRDGTFARHGEEPAPEDERSRWMGIAAAECSDGERRSEFVRRLRRMGAPLETHNLGRVFDAARAATRRWA